MELDCNVSRQAAFLDALDDWCTEHHDRFFTLSCPGDRGPSRHVAFLYSSLLVFARSRHGQCLRAALTNGIHALQGPEIALSVLQRGLMACQSLAEASFWVQNNIKVLGFRQIKVDCSMSEEEGLRHPRTGIYLV